MKAAWRALALLLGAAVLLQLFFVCRIALMAVSDPMSTSVQRSQAWQLATGPKKWRWHQQWVPYDRISDHLKRAVLTSEDDGFVDHSGVQWEAIQKAWQRNARAQARAAHSSQPVRIYGGSTITQQLAKNLLLSGERSLLRKGQELVLAKILELLLDKQRILELYLNSVEWGTGVFGAEAAAQHYFRKHAAQLSPPEAARLAVMLPQPRYYETTPRSTYLLARARAVLRRMGHTSLP